MTDAIDKAPRPQSVRYWTELEDTAFVLWFQNGRNFARVEEILNTDPMWREVACLEEGDPVPQAQTIRRWAKNGFWDHKAAQKMHELTPIRIEAAALELAYGSEDAAKSAMRIARGENVTREDRTVLEAAKFVLSSTLGDSIVGVVKPAVQKSVDIDHLESMQDVVEAEQRLRELDE